MSSSTCTVFHRPGVRDACRVRGYYCGRRRAVVNERIRSEELTRQRSWEDKSEGGGGFHRCDRRGSSRAVGSRAMIEEVKRAIEN